MFWKTVYYTGVAVNEMEKRFFFIAIFGIILGIAAIFYGWVSGTASMATATLSFSPPSGKYTVGQTLAVQILLNTDGRRTSGADVMFTFDKERLELLKIKEGSAFDQYLASSIDNTLGKGSLSGLVRPDNSLFTGKGMFAMLFFRAIKEGNARVQFVFTRGERNDSNVADFDKQDDILTRVVNGSYIIRNSSVK